MSPTLQSGQSIWITKWSNQQWLPINGIPFTSKNNKLINLTVIYRGDILAFHHQPLLSKPKSLLLKRIIALPDDHYSFRNHQLFINGVGLSESYLKQNMKTNYQPNHSLQLTPTLADDMEHLNSFAKYAARFGIGQKGIVPKHTVLVLGDNRNTSIDSRNFGFVPYTRIVGICLCN